MRILGIWALTLIGTSVAEAGMRDAPLAKPLKVTIYAATPEGPGKALGTVTIESSPHGAVLFPALSGLTPGHHGFHLHEGSSCAPSKKNGKAVPAGAAGGHYDPDKAGGHGSPWGEGHKGDLPAMFVESSGRAVYPVLAPRLTQDDFKGRALVIHAGADNHSDDPAPLGGGGARVACGVVPK